MLLAHSRHSPGQSPDLDLPLLNSVKTVLDLVTEWNDPMRVGGLGQDFTEGCEFIAR